MPINPSDLSRTAVLTFSDEFNAFSYWTGQAGTWDTGYPWTAANGGTNAGNGEEQWYINANYAPTAGLGTYSVQDGILAITAAPASAAIQQVIGGYDYTSGMITTHHSFSQTYGYFEMKAKLPAGQGLWPAFWLLPTDLTWPPEIDIMEVIGSKTDQLVTSVHYDSGGYQMSSDTTVVSGMTTGFHTYGVDWQKDAITWYFDGQQVFKIATPAGMDKPMYMLANLAVGGEWPGSPDSSTSFPARLEIDYIRAYSALPEDGGGGTQPPATGQKLFSLPGTVAARTTVLGTYAWDNLKGTSSHDRLVGKQGGDTMRGYAGSDTYYVENRYDKVIESVGNGIDTVRTALARYQLTANVENLVLTGRGDQVALGNGLNNRLFSNNIGDNTLSGGAGNDHLNAGLYADVLIGGSGRDQFIFKKAPVRAGHIKDFAPGIDMLDLRGLFTGQQGNPVADGRLIFKNNGAGDTLVKAKAASGAMFTVTVLDNVSPHELYAQADYFYM